MNTLFGLGDLAYYLFRPAVYLIDWTWGTDLKDCDKCKLRRKKWNGWFSVPTWFAIIFLLVIIWAITFW
jgi:hypothetical protein